MAIESNSEKFERRTDKASDRVAESEAIGDSKQNKQHKAAIDANPDKFVSVSEGMEAVQPLVLEDSENGEVFYDASKNREEISTGNSYAEGLKAVSEEDQAKYSIDYINRKAVKLGHMPVDGNLIRTVEPSVEPVDQIRFESGGASEIMTPEERKAGEPYAVERAAELANLYSHRGKEDEYMDYDAFQEAYKAFPQFENHQNIRWELIAAMVRNEQHYYMDVKEKVDEQKILDGKGDELHKKKSIGPAQMQVRRISELIEKFPQLTDPKLGGIRKEHVLEDALKPDKAAWLATAYIANRITRNEELGRIVNAERLIQDYNPGGKQHYAHVMRQLEIILKKFYVNNDNR